MADVRIDLASPSQPSSSEAHGSHRRRMEPSRRDGVRPRHDPSRCSAQLINTAMTSSRSTHSISPSSSSGDLEPELSQSLGSVSSFDLRTPLKPSLAANHLFDPNDSFNVLGLHKNAAPAAARPVKNLLAEALAARKVRPASNPSETSAFNEPSSTATSQARLPSTENVSPKSLSQSSSRPFPAASPSSPLNRPNKPKLTLPSLAPSAFARSNLPQTPVDRSSLALVMVLPPARPSVPSCRPRRSSLP